MATDVGVFMTKTNGRDWLRVGKGLPLAPITDIDFIKKGSRLFAATYGRGIYSVKLPASF
ncbi:MAG: hypothetical protein M3280_03225 [Actinomycetota bacterium]|nr:hypothetical protein [Actinomycetota bacterium]